jgi:hypothetical protein
MIACLLTPIHSRVHTHIIYKTSLKVYGDEESESTIGLLKFFEVEFEKEIIFDS